MTRVIALGECMVELGLTGPDRAQIGYAGDSFNTAIYLRRLGIETAYATALGAGDPFSQAILAAMAEEGLAADLVVQVPGRLPGLYAIQRDPQGERRFFYWRGEAPAREYLSLIDPAKLEATFREADLVYLSAISLAIVGDAGRTALMRALAEVGPAVAFDTNYRTPLWSGPQAALAAIEAVAPLCRYLSLGAQDATALGEDDAEALARRWAHEGTEVILRCDDRRIAVFSADRVESFAAEPAVEAVDTTGAGDSFNAGYLAARLQGRDVGEAVVGARRLAGVVVQHPGAIIPRSAMPG